MSDSSKLYAKHHEIKKDHNDYRIIRICATDNHMAAYLNLELVQEGVSHEGLVKKLEIKELIEATKITYGVDEEAIEQVVQAAAEGKNSENILLATGREVVDGVDGYIDFIKRPSGMVQQGLTEMKNASSVDYKETSAFDNVQEGDLIAVYVPPIDGQGGEDIYGRVNPPNPVNDVIFTPAESVEYNEETREFKALNYGHVTFQRHLISVEQIYAVNGDVDLRQGNIRFIGKVEIKGDVLDDFEVTAEKGIQIGGTAEACILKSGTDLQVKGGITGKDKGKIEVKGNIYAHYLNEVDVIAGGDVIVEKEIVNSKIKALGRVIITQGSIVGGEVVALQGIVTNDAGSELGVKTLLTAGLDYHIADKFYKISKSLLKQVDRQKELLQTLGSEIELALKRPVVPNEQRSSIDDMWHEAKALQKRIGRLEKESGELSQNFADVACPYIEVRKNVFPGVVFVTARYEMQAKKPMQGPLLAEPDEIEKTVRICEPRSNSPVTSTPLRPPAWEDNDSDEDA